MRAVFMTFLIVFVRYSGFSGNIPRSVSGCYADIGSLQEVGFSVTGEHFYRAGWAHVCDASGVRAVYASLFPMGCVTHCTFSHTDFRRWPWAFHTALNGLIFSSFVFARRYQSLLTLGAITSLGWARCVSCVLHLHPPKGWYSHIIPEAARIFGITACYRCICNFYIRSLWNMFGCLWVLWIAVAVSFFSASQNGPENLSILTYFSKNGSNKFLLSKWWSKRSLILVHAWEALVSFVRVSHEDKTGHCYPRCNA